MDCSYWSKIPKIVIIKHSKEKPQITEKMPKLSFISSSPDSVSLSSLPTGLLPPAAQYSLPEAAVTARRSQHRTALLAQTPQSPSAPLTSPALPPATQEQASTVHSQLGSLQAPECDPSQSDFRPLLLLSLLPGITSQYLTNPKCSFPF